MSIRNTKEAKRLIEAMAPEGEFLAFINEREAQMLRDAGGSGIMTLAGIPSFVDFGGSGTGYGSASDTFSSAAGGGSSSDDDGYGSGDEFARPTYAQQLTRGPTIDTTGEDQEVDNARMMQALGIPPGVTFSGTDNLINPGGGPSLKDIGINAILYQLATKNPKAFAALQVGKAVKDVYGNFMNPDLGLNLTKMEEKELTTLQRGEDLGLNNAKQSERLEELKDKKAAEEEKK
jgi:hypothetical protein